MIHNPEARVGLDGNNPEARVGLDGNNPEARVGLDGNNPEARVGLDGKDRHVGISLVIGARTLHGPTGGSVFKDEDVAPGGHGPPLSCIAITSRHTGISGE